MSAPTTADQVRASFLERITWGDDANLEWLEPSRETTMPIVIGLAEEYERAANMLATFAYTDTPSGVPMFPRVVETLRRLAANERERLERKVKGTPKRKGQARTVQAHVGRGKGKAGNFTIKRERLGQ